VGGRALGRGLPRRRRAEDSITYKYQTTAKPVFFFWGMDSLGAAQSAWSRDLGPDRPFKLQGVIDAMQVPSPTGQAAREPDGGAAVAFTERARRGAAEFSRQFPG